MWYAQSIESTLKKLSVNPTSGLTDTEAQKRLEQHGPNKLTARKKKTFLQLFFAQLNDALIYVLLGAVVVTLFMGEYIDSVIIMLVVIINALLGVVQEVKAGRAIEALQKMTSPRTLVKRDGRIIEINAEKVVPGDVVVLDAGRFIPADLRLIESANLQIEESALTGESMPSQKDASKLLNDPKTPLGDRVNTAYLSTLVTYGRGLGVVTETGMNTEVGKIAGAVEEDEPPTPLEKRLAELGRMLGKVAIGICLLIFLIALLQGRDLADMFLIAVSLAVASIPEGLVAIVAVVLSIGVTAMSKRNAIIKRLPAVETLGSVNRVCSDKTGTLTQNRMTVTRYFTSKGEVAVDDKLNQKTPEDAELLAKAMILSSDATYEKGKGTGDPTEIALLILGDELGIDRTALNTRSQRIDEVPFDSDRKLMSTLVKEDNIYTVYTKGAIDSLLKKCTRALHDGKENSLTQELKNTYLQAAENMSIQALRTLAVAFKPVEKRIDPSEMEKDLIFIGLVGMIDPPREEVKQAIEKAKQAGVTTLMITGDHKNTAFAIARELGIAQNIEQAITGTQVDDYPGEELKAAIDDFRVFARVSPQHKVKIVQALKARGNLVSMTGDGVNDAPSLNTADIGVAMGITGTDVAKSASDMILTDDNFSTIISAIEQGRNIYNNIRKSVMFLLTSNMGEVVLMFISILIGLPAPLIATQLLWINLLTDSLPAIALGMDPGDPDVMKEQPRPPDESLFAHGMGIRALLGGLLIGGLTLFAFWYGYYEHGYSPFDQDAPETTLRYARTMAFMSIIACQLFYSLAFRNRVKSIFKIGLFSNKYLVGAIVLGFLLQLVVMGVPVLQEAFKLQMLDMKGWLVVLVVGLVPLIVNELVKVILRKKGLF